MYNDMTECFEHLWTSLNIFEHLWTLLSWRTVDSTSTFVDFVDCFSWFPNSPSGPGPTAARALAAPNSFQAAAWRSERSEGGAPGGSRFGRSSFPGAEKNGEDSHGEDPQPSVDSGWSPIFSLGDHGRSTPSIWTNISDRWPGKAKSEWMVIGQCSDYVCINYMISLYVYSYH